SLKTRLCEIDTAIPSSIPAKNFIFRLNRDVRFGGPPYKTHLSCVFPKMNLPNHPACFYVHVEPNNESFVGGGIYNPESGVLNRLREAIGEDGEGANRLKKLVNGERFKKTAPKGYAKDHEMIEFLRLKSFVVSGGRFDDEVVASEGFVDKVVEIFKDLYPFIALLNDFLRE
ncbi:hypothetical protein HDU76_007726, partial [Blyttiomyces sp. JEL0837]